MILRLGLMIQSFKILVELYATSTSSAPFLDMLEDYACNVPHTWDASQGILTGDLTPQQAGDDHEQCVLDLIETKY